MSCNYPLRGYDLGNPKLKVLGRGAPPSIKDKLGNWVKGIDLPCGKCISCRLNYSRQWAVRSHFEAIYWPNNYFLTLTYSNEHLPSSSYVSAQSGEVLPTATLLARDLVLFWKRLRKHYSSLNHSPIRFMAAGEYGDVTHRPHYHSIVYNLPIPDLTLYQRGFKGDYFQSPLITSIWGKGHVIIGDVSFESAAYVARYVLKKQTSADNRVRFEELGESPEFVRHSRRPGLARRYFDENYSRIYATDELHVPRKGGVVTCRPVSYFDKLYKEINPAHLEQLKLFRLKSAEDYKDLVLSTTEFDEFEQAKLADHLLGRKVEKLARFKV